MDLKKWGAEDPKLQKYFDTFSKEVLAIWHADYLLANLDSFPTIDEGEVRRERWHSNQNAQTFFSLMEEIGIPENLLSAHLHFGHIKKRKF